MEDSSYLSPDEAVEYTNGEYSPHGQYSPPSPYYSPRRTPAENTDLIHPAYSGMVPVYWPIARLDQGNINGGTSPSCHLCGFECTRSRCTWWFSQYVQANNFTGATYRRLFCTGQCHGNSRRVDESRLALLLREELAERFAVLLVDE
jgi:hypothetical protein